MTHTPRSSSSLRPQASSSTSASTAVHGPASPASCCRRCKDFTNTPWGTIQSPDKYPGQPLPGWPSLARLIKENPDFEAFPAFKDLNIKSLLYYQSELHGLRERLHKLEWEDHRNGSFNRAEEFGERVDAIWTACKDEDVVESLRESARQQKKLIKKIRKVLKQYNDALVQYSQLAEFPAADCFNLRSLRNWLSKAGLENVPIKGPGAQCWGNYNQPNPAKVSLKRQFLRLLCTLFWAKKPEKNDLDLIVPRKSNEVDSLARWVANEFVPFWHNLRHSSQQNDGQEEDDHSSRNTRKWILPWTEKSTPAQLQQPTPEERIKNANAPEPTLITYHEDRMLRFTSSVATVLACLLPTIAITVLTLLHTTAQLLGLIAVFTGIFAIGLLFLTDGTTSRVEIFTATAAFSAVMVVFVQNQNEPAVLSLTSLISNATHV